MPRGRKPKPLSPREGDAAPPAKMSDAVVSDVEILHPFTTTDYEVVKKLYNAGIQAVDSHGSPMVFVYDVANHDRIKAVLG